MGFSSVMFLMLIVVNPQKSLAGFLYNPVVPGLSRKVDLSIKLIGEIIGYSYIKMEVEPYDNPKRYKTVTIALKGHYYEAITSKSYKIIGTFNTKTLVWKIDCFDNNSYMGVFIGKENSDGRIEGNWTSKNIIHRFYLQRTKKN